MPPAVNIILVASTYTDRAFYAEGASFPRQQGYLRPESLLCALVPRIARLILVTHQKRVSIRLQIVLMSSNRPPPGFPIVGGYGWNDLEAVLLIEPEVAVQGQDDAFRMQFRHPHETAAGQRHGHVAVLVKQAGNGFRFSGQVKRQIQNASLRQVKHES